MPRAANKTVNKTAEDIVQQEDLLEIAEDTEAVDGNTDQQPDPKQPTPEETVLDLKKQLEAANTERQAALDRANRAEKDRTEAHGKVHTAVDDQVRAQEMQISSMIDASTIRLSALRTQIKEAKETGNVDREVELIEEMADAKLQLNAANWNKTQLENWKTQREAARKAPQQEQSGGKFSPKEQDWIERNPRFNSDPDYRLVVIGAANQALERGFKQDSDEFFNHINSAVGRLQPAVRADAREDRDTDPTSIAAPPSRNGANGGVTHRPNHNAKWPYIPQGFKIPADWVEAAKYQGFDDPREYANIRLEEQAKEKERQ